MAAIGQPSGNQQIRRGEKHHRRFIEGEEKEEIEATIVHDKLCLWF